MKKPSDILIIGSILSFLSFMLCLLGLLQITGIAYMTGEDSRRVFFGVFLIDSNFSHGVRELIYGLWSLVACIGLLRMKNWARYLLLFYHVVAIVDTLFVLSKIPPIASAVGITLSLFVIVWLLHRKPIFVNPNETIKSVI